MVGGLHVELDSATDRRREIDEAEMPQPVRGTQKLGTRIDGEAARQLEVEIHERARSPVAPRSNRDTPRRNVAGLCSLPAPKRIHEDGYFERYAGKAPPIHHFCATTFCKICHH